MLRKGSLHLNCPALHVDPVRTNAFVILAREARSVCLDPPMHRTRLVFVIASALCPDCCVRVGRTMHCVRDALPLCSQLQSGVCVRIQRLLLLDGCCTERAFSLRRKPLRLLCPIHFLFRWPFLLNQWPFSHTSMCPCFFHALCPMQHRNLLRAAARVPRTGVASAVSRIECPIAWADVVRPSLIVDMVARSPTIAGWIFCAGPCERTHALQSLLFVEA
mmetsp:Transcript_30735/g.56345  ORF Transcript_30735/g.56345 Transcript_30735/m.56345 type:complete len:219 (-) Transcript_30735:156-812(-)